MLSYQHIYHAGCLADVHKHALLSVILHKMAQKPSPMTYMETHAGRGLYDLSAPEAVKTGEAASGILRLLGEDQLAATHPYMQALGDIANRYGQNTYPGSPAIAAHFLRDGDAMQLMELHPGEVTHLRRAMRRHGAQIHHRDGYEGVLAVSPPEKRRGMVLIDPSYEIKSEYTALPGFITKLHRKWPEAVIMAWYPELTAGLHKAMREELDALSLPKTITHEVTFADAPPRGMTGSFVFIANTPYGLDDEFAEIAALFQAAS